MSEHPDSQKRLTPFLDCISYLLAKRWLKDQRQAARPPRERQEGLVHRDEPSES